MQTLAQGTEIDPALRGLVRHMHALTRYGQAFDRLQASWDTLTMLGQLSGNAVEMSGTRRAFETLTASLINLLAVETRDKVLADLRTKAGNVIDVLVRNLFERTADIGFLAADTDIREMLESGSAGQEARGVIERRFREYVAKYSVYSDIILTDRSEVIRGRLAPHDATEADHPVIADALSGNSGYIEHYGRIPFVSDAPTLVYAWRVETESRQPLGVLVLAFRLADELADIFRNLLPEGDCSVLACITPTGRVIASSCPIQLPTGTVLPATALNGDRPAVRIGGRSYLAVACRSAGYQGYGGPGWVGLALAPLDMAFETGETDIGTGIDGVIDSASVSTALIPEALRAVSRQAALIQRDLNRAVWNGSIRQAGSGVADTSFSKILLGEISNAGGKTQAVVDASVSDLYRTVLAAILEKCRSRAAFAIDVMDRNLYERANDCRWWALNASLARILSGPAAGADATEAAAAAAILARINELYTVYSNLILFNRDGRVVAVSQPAQAALVGTTLREEWVQRTLTLRSSQDYVVSGFEPTMLYGGSETLVYSAAIQGAEGGGRAVGGIAIVFDAAPQFQAILHDSLPRDEAGGPLPGAALLFVGSDRRVISSSDPRFAIGQPCPLPLDLAALERDGYSCCIQDIGDQRAVIGAAYSKGYREYKVSDGHAANIAAVCIVPLGSARRQAVAERGHNEGVSLAMRRPGDQVATFEVATFHLGRHWLGVRAGDVVEAVEIDGLKPSATQADGGLLAGYKLHEGKPVPVLRLARLLGIDDSRNDGQQIVIVRTQRRTLGLIVDRLGPIPDIASADLQPLRDLTGRTDVPALGIVPMLDIEGAPAGMLMLLDVDRLEGRLDRSAAAAPVSAAA